MTIIRREHTKNYTTISNDCFHDDTLSAEALGVLCYLLSKPNDWRVMPAELANRFKSGRDKIYRIMNELSQAGYVLRKQKRDKETNTWKPTEYIVRDHDGGPLPENTEAGGPLPEKPCPEKPHTEKPCPENQTLLKKDSTKDRDSQRTESTSPSLSLGHVDDGFKLESEPFEAVLVSRKEQAESFFDKQFWPSYPKRFGRNPKEPAKKKIVAAILKGEEPEKILDGVKKLYAGLQRTGKIGTQFVPMSVTWINGKGWRDDPLPAGNGGQKAQSFLEAAQDLWSGDHG